jgi:hypothetical protein
MVELTLFKCPFVLEVEGAAVVVTGHDIVIFADMLKL